MNTRRALRIVEPAQSLSPEQTWLAVSAEIATHERRIAELRSIRQAVKPAIMSGLSRWGMRDEQITAELEGRR